MNDAQVCPHCGRPLDEHERDIRFGLPDPLLSIPKPELEERMWGNDLMMAVEGIGAFIRTILTVKLTGGYSIRYGLWLGLPEEELQRAYDVWEGPGYRHLVLDGRIANAIPPWGHALFGAPATASVIDKDELPYITSSDDPELAKVLAQEWDHNYVLDQWASASTELLDP